MKKAIAMGMAALTWVLAACNSSTNKAKEISCSEMGTTEKAQALIENYIDCIEKEDAKGTAQTLIEMQRLSDNVQKDDEQAMEDFEKSEIYEVLEAKVAKAMNNARTGFNEEIQTAYEEIKKKEGKE